LVQKSLQPDLTLILDMDPDKGLERARQRGGLDRFETQHLDFFKAVRRVYLERARSDPGRCVVIDASAELQVVKAAVLDAVAGICQQTS
jgi:dTMP kinase